MTTYLRKSCSFGLLRVPFVNCRQFMYLVISLWFWGQMWDLIVSVPDHCLSFYFARGCEAGFLAPDLWYWMARLSVGSCCWALRQSLSVSEVAWSTCSGISSWKSIGSAVSATLSTKAQFSVVTRTAWDIALSTSGKMTFCSLSSLSLGKANQHLRFSCRFCTWYQSCSSIGWLSTFARMHPTWLSREYKWEDYCLWWSQTLLRIDNRGTSHWQPTSKPRIPAYELDSFSRLA